MTWERLKFMTMKLLTLNNNVNLLNLLTDKNKYITITNNKGGHKHK